ncbi:MAG: ribosome maturation factor RimP [Clostridia bacterium]|nr:ribosome maturation factor RimP [Clostridia bacterium]
MAKKGSGSVAASVRELVAPVIEQMGYLLWSVEFVKEGADYFLRVTIDSEPGITLDDCEKVHRAIDPLLDEADPIEQSYYLEVYSPGLERELRTDEQIRWCENWDVELRLFAPDDSGTRIYKGVLLGLDDDGAVVLDTGTGKKTFPRASVAKLKTYYDFSKESLDTPDESGDEQNG